MRDILDPEGRWLGVPLAAAFSDNKNPVALDDTLDVLKNSGPMTVPVLANDFDPEGQPLTLVSASAALGTAVAEADNTVTYTPPTGITGFDTVVYEIADDLDQRRSAQINVTISEPELSVDIQPDNTLVVNAEAGSIDVTITQPAEFAGTYPANVDDLVGGPINLVPPVVQGTLAVGEVLDADPGIWIFDTSAGAIATSWQWRRDGSDIAGETGSTFTLQPSDIGPLISVVQTETDGFGQRSAESTAIGGFTPASDGQLLGWWDAADTSTITHSGGAVTDWADKAGGDALVQSTGNRQPATGTRLLNGANVIDFSGSHFLERAGFSLPGSGDVAFHMALVIDSIANSFEALMAIEATNDFQIDANHGSQFDGRLNATGIGTSVNLNGGPFAGALILSVVLDRTGAGAAEIFISNTSRAVMTYSTSVDATAALHVMTNRSKNAWVDGAVAELIVTGNIANRDDHHAYLASKWGLV